MSKERKGHDIDFFRGNVADENSDDVKVTNLEDSYTYSDFKFNKNKQPINPAINDQPINAVYNKPLREQPTRVVQPDAIKVREIEPDETMMNQFKEEEYYTEQPSQSKRKPLKPQPTEDIMAVSSANYANDNFNNNVPPTSNDGIKKKEKKKKEKKPKKKRGAKKIIIGLLLFLLLLIAALFAALFVIKNTAPTVNFMIIGVDQRQGQSETEIRADALINVNASTKSNRILMASIPRDTYTFLPCTEQKDKITHAYVFGAMYWEDKGGGPACTVQSASQLLDTKMTKYVKVNFDNTVGIIDAIGGVNIKATATFCEQDSKGKKDAFCFEEGKKYEMNGEMALAYSRHRKSDNDIARGLRQQEVFKAMFSEIKGANIWEWPGIYTKLSSMAQTNLSQIEMLQVMIIYATKGETENFEFEWGGVMYNGVSYVELNQNSLEEYIAKIRELK